MAKRWGQGEQEQMGKVGTRVLKGSRGECSRVGEVKDIRVLPHVHGNGNEGAA